MRCFETSHHHTNYLTLKAIDQIKMKGNNPYLVVILIQTIYAAMILLSKVAFDHGMDSFIFVFYRQAAATLFLTPFTFFFEWYVEILSYIYIYILTINFFSRDNKLMPVFKLIIILDVGKLHHLCLFGPSARFFSFLYLGMCKY